MSSYIFVGAPVDTRPLDEATSALDATSRLLVFEAIKAWRKNKTTVIITHDLSQIGPSDFLYLLKDGRVVEQGYRADLEANKGDDFRAMADAQGSGSHPDDPQSLNVQAEQAQADAVLKQIGETEAPDAARAVWATKHQSLGVALRPLTGTWMLDAISDFTRAAVQKHESNFVRASVPPPKEPKPAMPSNALRRHSSIAISPVAVPPVAHTHLNRRASLQFSPFSSTYSFKHMSDTDYTSSITAETPMFIEVDDEFEVEKSAIKNSGMEASRRRLGGSRSRRNESANLATLTVVPGADKQADSDERPLSVSRVFRDIWPSVPNKPLIALGLVTCLLSGSMTPLFSFMLSRLFFEVSAGAKAVGTITEFALITLTIAAADGFLAGLKSILMEDAAVRWITKIRKAGFALVLAQDKAWFDDSFNSPSRLVQVLVKDADDARTLLSTCLGMFVVVTTMLSVGLVWAMVWGWQLTLVGIAIVPLFAGATTMQTRLTSKFQLRNKRAREEVSKVYHEVSLSCLALSSCYLLISRSSRRLSRTFEVYARWRSRACSQAILTPHWAERFGLASGAPLWKVAHSASLMR